MSFIFNCPYCQQGIEAEDEWIGQEAECPGCGKTIKIEKNKPKIALKPINQQSGFQPQYGQQQFVQQQNFASGAGALTVMPAGPGTFNVSGDYFGIYTCVRQIFQECGWRIKEDNPVHGRLAGRCKYGINPSGIGVSAVFYLNGNAITLEFSASLSNAVDTMGLCSQKVAEFSTRLMELAPVFVPNVSMRPAAFPAMPPDFRLTVMPAGPGTFNVSGDYFGIYTCVRQIFQECGWRIKEDNPAQGRLAGSCKYGINPSGIGVTAVFYLNGNAITLEFSASLSNAFDTMGVCSQKVAEFSNRLMGLAPVFVPDVSMSPAAFPAMPPDFSRRIGESYAGKAKNALLCAVLGLLCAIFAVILAGRAAMAFIAFCALMGIFAMIFAGQALTGMSKSRNDEGKGFAIAAMFLGFIEIIVMGGFFFLRYFLR